MGPYKYRFRREFKRYLKFVDSVIQHPKTVLDAASAYGKFIPLFKDDYYVGIDCNADAIDYLRRVHEKNNCDFYLVDLVADQIPNCANSNSHEEMNGYDLVITTHTLSQIDPRDHIRVIDKLIGATKNEGFIILHINTEYSKTIEHIEKTTIVLKRVKYRGLVSNIMEKHLPVHFHKSAIGVFVNGLLSFFDFGSTDCILLCRTKADR